MNDHFSTTSVTLIDWLFCAFDYSTLDDMDKNVKVRILCVPRSKQYNFQQENRCAF